MKITIKIPASMRNMIFADLQREHPNSPERVGIGFARHFKTDNEIIVLIFDYKPLPDDYYEAYRHGAKINSNAIRFAMENGYEKDCGIFHIHMHEGDSCVPEYSYIDEEGLPPLIESFRNVKRNEVHGSLLLNTNEANAWVAIPNSEKLLSADKIISVGRPLQISFPKITHQSFSEKFSRQTFLGETSERNLRLIKIGVIGLGGAGSHVIQQVGHMGFKNVVGFDFDVTDESNRNRNVGSTKSDARNKIPKSVVAERLYKSIEPEGTVQFFGRWEEHPEELASCDIVIGGVDLLLVRRDIEGLCRRYLIPYVDIGMDVTEVSKGYFVMGGQVILSLPGHACMHCLSFFKEKELEKEGKRYGDAGHNPQVVWANGVLASTAVGIVGQLCTGWSKDSPDGPEYLMYNGNLGTVTEDPRLKLFGKKNCTHFPIEEIGPIKIFNH